MIVREMFLGQEMDQLHRYLNEVATRAGSIADAIKAEDETDLDLEILLEYPIALQELGVRTVYHELTAIVEHQVQGVLTHLRKSLGDTDRRQEDHPTEMHFEDIQKEIGKVSAIVLAQLPGAGRVADVRAVAIDLKHRKGLKKLTSANLREFPEFHRLEVRAAHAAIDAVLEFTRSLWAEAHRFRSLCGPL